MTIGHIGEDFRTFSWVGEGWSKLRDRAHSALTPFRHEAETTTEEPTSDSSDTTPKASATAPNWGLVAADVTEFPDRVEVRVEIPGVSRDELQVEIRGGRLTVSGEKRAEHTRNEGNLVITERAFGRFFRAVPLPAEVDAQSADANYEDGVLNVTLKRTKDSRTHQVPVA